jgi:hypothetical protein
MDNTHADARAPATSDEPLIYLFISSSGYCVAIYDLGGSKLSSGHCCTQEEEEEEEVEL